MGGYRRALLIAAISLLSPLLSPLIYPQVCLAGDALSAVELLNPEAFSDEDRRSLLRGVEDLPSALFELVDEPLRIAYVDRPCLYGMGRYNETCPTFGEDGEFFLYQSPPLPPEARQVSRDLQVRRALVHLVMFHVEQSTRWSQEAAFRSINGWPRPRPIAADDRPANLDTYGYSRPLGMRSATLDLITFAEEYFARPDGGDPDMAAECQHFSKTRFFDDRLPELLPGFEPSPRGECPAFQAWARPDVLAGVDLLLAAPTARRPESLYGHLLLHVRYEGSGPGFEPVYQFGAVTDTDISPMTFFGRGLTGGFPTILELATFRAIDRHFLQHQQRSLERYHLRLDDEEGLRVLERIWETERRVRYSYAFLTRNCASFLVDLLAPIVDPALVDRPTSIALPTDVLDLLARYETIDGESLIRRRSPLPSNREVAAEALDRRQETFDDLMDELPDHTDAFQEIRRSLQSRDPDDRRDALIALSDLMNVALRDRQDLGPTAFSALYDSVLIERYFMELAFFARRTVYVLASGASQDFTAEELLEMRRELYRDEDLERRVAALNAMAFRLEEELEEGAMREFTSREQEILDEEARVRAAYMAALQAQGRLIEEFLPGFDARGFLADREEARDLRAAEIDARSTARSGRHRVGLGARYAGAGGPALEVYYAAVDDRLGELRSRGYGPLLESRIMALELSVPLNPRGLSNLQADGTLFRYASLRTFRPPLSRGLRDRFGWSLDLSAHHDGRRDLLADVTVTPSLLLPLWIGDPGASHLILEAGPTLSHHIHRQHAPYAGGRAGLQARIHLGGGYVNALGLSAETLQLLSPDLQWHFDARARQSVALRVRQTPHRDWVVHLFSDLLITTRSYRRQSFQEWSVGLRLEL